jgi:hypothetical protein
MANYAHPSFHYHAAGHAVSGEFVRPIKYLIEAQAATTLPLAGGHARAQVENFEVAQLTSIAKGQSHVSGSEDSLDKHTSHSTVVVEQLNILDMVTADRLVARLTSEHGPRDKEGHVITLGTKIENLRIAGYPVQLELDHSFSLEHATFQQLSKTVAAMQKSGRMAQESRGVILCSLAKNVKVECPGVQVQGHVITVPHFGEISIGEMLVEPGSKRLTLLRLQLGSPHKGKLTIAEAHTNGRTWP